MVTKFESLPDELIMIIIEFVDNPHLFFLNLNSNINRILFDHRLKLSVKIENNRYQIVSLPTNLTRLVLMNFNGENLRIFQNLKSLTLFINENFLVELKLPLSIVYLKINFNDDISPLLFKSLSILKRLQTLIINNKKQVECNFPLDTTIFSRNIKILQLKNISTTISLIHHCEELTQLKYLELRLTKGDQPFDYISFIYPLSLKTLIIHSELSFTELEHVLSGCIQGNLKYLQLYSQSKTSQTDYFDEKRWLKLFEQFQYLTKCQIQLQQRGRRGLYHNLCKQFAQQLKSNKNLKEKWNMKCSSACPGYHGTNIYVLISANLRIFPQSTG